MANWKISLKLSSVINVSDRKKDTMNNFFRTIIAAWGAKKLGGGCLSTVVIFVLIYTLLGKCNQTTRANPSPAHVKVHAVKGFN